MTEQIVLLPIKTFIFISQYVYDIVIKSKKFTVDINSPIVTEKSLCQYMLCVWHDFGPWHIMVASANGNIFHTTGEYSPHKGDIYAHTPNSDCNLVPVPNQPSYIIIIYNNIVSGLDTRGLFLTILIKHYITEYYIINQSSFNLM